jgi:hypothetical protein
MVNFGPRMKVRKAQYSERWIGAEERDPML